MSLTVWFSYILPWLCW